MKKMVRGFCIVITFFGLALLTKNTAQDQRNYSLKDLCTFSNDIVITQIKSINYSFDDSIGRITTEITCTILEHLKGDYLKDQNEFKMIYPGGVKGEMVQFVPGAPNFKKGEKSILFLNERYPSSYKVLLSVFGMSEGKFNITYDKVSNMDYIQPDNINQETICIDSDSNQKIFFNLSTRMKFLDFKETIKKFL